MKAILVGTYFQILNFLRVKKAFFFSFVFPIFLYLIFTFVWGNHSITYAKFILSGIVAITIASNAMMALGKVIVEYNKNGLTRILKSIPRAYAVQIFALILSRAVLLSFSFLFLLLIAYLVSGVALSTSEILNYEVGIFVGILVFTLIGQIIADVLEDNHSENSISNGIFYIIIFVSDCFYPVTEMNPFLKTLVAFNPITPILHLIRGEEGWIIPIVIELIILLIFFRVLSIKKVQKR